ncbi:MAG: hypothetical protein HY514_02050 [Candidatus Aenigmarchaeota archaeon]|nr:hypothetical protein [Candidatus Aenigmarchaeota archaeon]
MTSDTARNSRIARRLFLSGAATLPFACYQYLYNTEMARAPKIPGMIIADIHTHPGKYHDAASLTGALSDGITGLTQRYKSSNIVTYEDALSLPGAMEMDKGLFACLGAGYFMKTQEVMSNYHILAAGCRKYIPHWKDARKTVDEVHRQNGLAILNHPFLQRTDGLPLIKRLEDGAKELDELLDIVDEIEVFNGYCVSAVPQAMEQLPGIPDMLRLRTLNERAKDLAEKSNRFKGIATSDAHYNLKSIQTAGIYIRENCASMEGLMYCIKTGNFERYEKTSDRMTFFRGLLRS